MFALLVGELVRWVYFLTKFLRHKLGHQTINGSAQLCDLPDEP